MKSLQTVQMLKYFWSLYWSISEVYTFLLNFTMPHKLRNEVQNMAMKMGILCRTEVAWLARNMQPNYIKLGLCSQNNFSERNTCKSENYSKYSITLLLSKMAVPTCQSTWWRIPHNHNLNIKMHSLPLSRNCLSILLEKMRIFTKEILSRKSAFLLRCPIKKYSDWCCEPNNTKLTLMMN